MISVFLDNVWVLFMLYWNLASEISSRFSSINSLNLCMQRVALRPFKSLRPLGKRKRNMPWNAMFGIFVFVIAFFVNDHLWWDICYLSIKDSWQIFKCSLSFYLGDLHPFTLVYGYLADLLRKIFKKSFFKEFRMVTSSLETRKGMGSFSPPLNCAFWSPKKNFTNG